MGILPAEAQQQPASEFRLPFVALTVIIAAEKSPYGFRAGRAHVPGELAPKLSQQFPLRGTNGIINKKPRS